jgi:hypothetical protein
LQWIVAESAVVREVGLWHSLIHTFEVVPRKVCIRSSETRLVPNRALRSAVDVSETPLIARIERSIREIRAIGEVIRKLTWVST